jgi:hypothetical protein
VKTRWSTGITVTVHKFPGSVPDIGSDAVRPDPIKELRGHYPQFNSPLRRVSPTKTRDANWVLCPRNSRPRRGRAQRFLFSIDAQRLKIYARIVGLAPAAALMFGI